jgi:phytoene/squalene synthetase
MFSARIMGRIYHGILEEIVRSGYDVYRRRIGVSTRRKIRIALGVWFASRLPGRRPVP